MFQYQCSVLVVQYNPSFEKIKRTLNSIICQENCTFEIIIADDGSKNTYFEQTEQYLLEKNVKQYQFIKNNVNQGTVKNILSGLKVAKGKYVRVIAPGDMLYNNRTLCDIVAFMEKNNAKEIFGKMVSFQEKNDDVLFLNQNIPRNVIPYKENNEKLIKKYLVEYGDNISGASFTWETEYYLECLTRICDKVIYLEDCINIFTIYDGHSIFYFDQYVTWYEYGTGISTKGNDKWVLLIWEDWKSFFDELNIRYPGDKVILRTKRYWDMRKKRNFIGKIVDNLVYIKRYMYYKTNENKGVISKDENLDKESFKRFYYS